jgi:hypothetical protein
MEDTAEVYTAMTLAAIGRWPVAMTGPVQLFTTILPGKVSKYVEQNLRQ